MAKDEPEISERAQITYVPESEVMTEGDDGTNEG